MSFHPAWFPAGFPAMNRTMRRVLVVVGLPVAAFGWLLFFGPLPEILPVPGEAKAPDKGVAELHPLGGTVEMNHGHPTEDVYVLLHGVTSTPVQFQAFGKLLYDRGANVLIPRMPFHGHQDRMTGAHKFFTAQVMLDEANRAIARAKTMGRRVTVIGLSVNGITAAWIAQNRADVEAVVIMAPFLAARGMPGWSIAPVARLFSLLPNFFVWWDFQEKENLGEDSPTYPRFSTRSLASLLQFGLVVFREAEAVPPQVRRILLMTSAWDSAINNRRAGELADLWKASAPGRVETYQFPEELEVPHDWMDPSQPDQRVDLVHPILLELLSDLQKKERIAEP